MSPAKLFTYQRISAERFSIALCEVRTCLVSLVSQLRKAHNRCCDHIVQADDNSKDDTDLNDSKTATPVSLNLWLRDNPTSLPNEIQVEEAKYFLIFLGKFSRLDRCGGRDSWAPACRCRYRGYESRSIKSDKKNWSQSRWKLRLFRYPILHRINFTFNKLFCRYYNSQIFTFSSNFIFFLFFILSILLHCVPPRIHSLLFAY